LITVFTTAITSRLEYVIGFMSKFYGVPVYLLDKNSVERNTSKILINYTENKHEEAFQVIPSGLLEEKGIKDFSPIIEKDFTTGLPYFFGTQKSDFHFDIFSFTFYLLTRYEEYSNGAIQDEHGRYDVRSSLAFKHGFLDIALIDRWLIILRNKLEQSFGISFPQKSHEEDTKIIMTYDIDFPWAFLHRPWYINMMALFKDLFLHRNIALFSQRFATLILRKKDPYDTYDIMLDSLRHLPDQIIFFLMRSGTKFDRNHQINQDYFKKLIQKMSQSFKIGLHPSYYSSAKPEEIFKEELIRLNKIVGEPTKASRMHFLRLKLPDTYHMLLSYGIQEDYSMGYAQESGFRSSTSQRHKWYDLEKEVSTDLTIVPLIFMDTTFISNKKASLLDAQITMEQLIHEVRLHQGYSSILWHNNNIALRKGQNNWRRLYEWSIEKISGGLNTTI